MAWSLIPSLVLGCKPLSKLDSLKAPPPPCAVQGRGGHAQWGGGGRYICTTPICCSQTCTSVACGNCLHCNTHIAKELPNTSLHWRVTMHKYLAFSSVPMSAPLAFLKCRGISILDIFKIFFCGKFLLRVRLVALLGWGIAELAQLAFSSLALLHVWMCCVCCD